MKTFAKVLVLAAAMAVGGVALAVDPLTYTGNYPWLAMFHATATVSEGGYGPNPGSGWAWMAAYPANNLADHWIQLTWPTTVNFTGSQIKTWQQFNGGSIGEWLVQTSPDGSTGWTTVATNPSDGQYNNSYSASGKALRVLFQAGKYNVGTSGNYGPGVDMFQVRGNYAGGMDSTDPNFNLLATTGYYGVSPTVSFAGRAAQEGPASYLKDNVVGSDGPRAGWYPAMDGTESIVVDLGATTSPITVTGVKLYGGTFYQYLPGSMDVYLSNDGINWGTKIGTASLVGNITQLSGFSQDARYLKLTNPPLNSSYILPVEIVVNGFAHIPEPTTLLLGVGGLLAVFSGRRRSAK